VAISVDAPDAGATLARRLGLTYPVASDPEREVIASYGVLDAENEISWPAIFVVGKDGAIAWRWLADDYKLRVSGAEVLSALGGLK
jgi:peroxiredoxin